MIKTVVLTLILILLIRTEVDAIPIQTRVTPVT